jgi:hypothetical protein
MDPEGFEWFDASVCGPAEPTFADMDGDGWFDTVLQDSAMVGPVDVQDPGPDDVSTAIMDATVVGPATDPVFPILAVDPLATADPFTQQTLQDIDDAQADTGFVWTLPDGFVRERPDEW